VDTRKPQEGGQPLYWHSNANVFGELLPGDHLWVVTSGKAIEREPASAGFLIAIWHIAEIVKNPGDDPAFRAGKFGYRVIVDESESKTFNDAVLVDHAIRPVDADKKAAIGRYLRMPRRLNNEKLRQFRAAAGAELALQWLTGNRK
jgi:hypothetical protein